MYFYQVNIDIKIHIMRTTGTGPKIAGGWFTRIKGNCYFTKMLDTIINIFCYKEKSFCSNSEMWKQRKLMCVRTSTYWKLHIYVKMRYNTYFKELEAASGSGSFWAGMPIGGRDFDVELPFNWTEGCTFERFLPVDSMTSLVVLL